MTRSPQSAAATVPARPGSGGPVRRFFRLFGPGVITGAADDDPSGITTYSVTGAQFGTSLLWTAVVTWPLMAAVQMMCARIGMVTGQGLAGALQKKLPRRLVLGAAFALFLANTLNVGADLAGMADAAADLTGWNSSLYVVIFGAGIAALTITCRYAQICAILKWLVLVLFSYVVGAFLTHPAWGAILHDTFRPAWPKTHDARMMLVALLGTTISPYLFFWQSSQEVEEEKAAGRRMLVLRHGATRNQLLNRRIDVSLGTFFSNLVMFFIIVTCAMTLHRSGQTHIETAREAAAALRPLAGNLASLLYTVGIIGVGILAIPTMTGSAAYAFAETLHWRQGLDEKFKGARAFYAVVVVSSLCGILLNFLGVNPVKALVWTAVVNGVLSPFLLVGILLVASDRKIMKGQISSRASRIVVAVTAVAMFAAAIGMLWA
jgi:NRAMP (natural resistance-associated macrophage protein)-like metal ion transporter